MEEKIKELEDRVTKLEARNAKQDRNKKILIIVVVVLAVITGIIEYYFVNQYISTLGSIF